MKRSLLCIVLALLAISVAAQDNKSWKSRDDGKPKFELPDSLKAKAWTPYKYSAEFDPGTFDNATPVISMSSLTEAEIKNTPKRVKILENNALRIGRVMMISNGQAWNWGPYPNSYLDARTLSFPMPR